MSASAFYQAFVPPGDECVMSYERSGEIVVELQPLRANLQMRQMRHAQGACA